MNIRTLTALVPVSILAAAMAVSNAQKNKKQSHAEKISANVPNQLQQNLPKLAKYSFSQKLQDSDTDPSRPE